MKVLSPSRHFFSVVTEVDTNLNYLNDFMNFYLVTSILVKFYVICNTATVEHQILKFVNDFLKKNYSILVFRR